MPEGTSVVEHEILVAAVPETVFAYFTDPAKLVQWMGAEATLDPRPGGVCRIVFRPSQAAAELLAAVEQSASLEPRVMMGRFVEVDPYRRIAFTWGWERDLYAIPPQSTAVEVSLTPAGDGTVVRLTHRRVPPSGTVIHRAGWQHYLPRLALAAADEGAGPDPWQA